MEGECRQLSEVGCGGQEDHSQTLTQLSANRGRRRMWKESADKRVQTAL